MIMNKENASKLWKMIQEAGDYLLCQWFCSVDTSYVVYLTFIKNKSYRDSFKTHFKLGTVLDIILDILEINQIVHSSAFW